MQILQVNMGTIETTFHKTNYLQYMYAVILTLFSLLTFSMFIIAIFRRVNKEIIYLYINISICRPIGTYSLLTI